VNKTFSTVLGTGGFLPQKVVTNADLAKTVDTSDEWIVARTGIRRRHVAAPGETTCDLAEQAAATAISAAGITASDLDLIIVATTTADYVFPSTACVLQERIGAGPCPAFDVQAVCAGFIYALDTADKHIRTGAARCVLVVGAETFSRIIDWSDRATCVLFGDGAGAMVLGAGSEPGIMSTHLYADGKYKELLWVPSGVSTNYQAVTGARAYTQMQGPEVFKVAVQRLGDAAVHALGANGLSAADVDWLVPHQANLRIINATTRRLGLADDKVVLTIADHGNTSAASIPLAFDVAVRDGRIRRGHRVLVEGFGGGFAWGSALLVY